MFDASLRSCVGARARTSGTSNRPISKPSRRGATPGRLLSFEMLQMPLSMKTNIEHVRGISARSSEVTASWVRSLYLCAPRRWTASLGIATPVGRPTSERRTPKPRVEVSSPGLGKSTGFHSREWNSHSTKWEPPFPTTEHPHHRSGVSLLGWGCPSPGMGCLHSLHRDLPFPATEATHHGYGFPLPCWLTSHQGNGSLHT